MFFVKITLADDEAASDITLAHLRKYIKNYIANMFVHSIKELKTIFLWFSLMVGTLLLTKVEGQFKDILDKISFGYLCQIITPSTFKQYIGSKYFEGTNLGA